MNKTVARSTNSFDRLCLCLCLCSYTRQMHTSNQICMARFLLLESRDIRYEFNSFIELSVDLVCVCLHAYGFIAYAIKISYGIEVGILLLVQWFIILIS